MLKLDRETKGISCGIDEVGRAPLAGPVVAACVTIKQECERKSWFWYKVRDSKDIAREDREHLVPKIKEYSYFGIGMASEREIEDLNIHNASLLAMKRAYERMLDEFPVRPDVALVDGRFTPKITINQKKSVIKGDRKSRAIAAASIIAKVHRDNLMLDLHKAFPVYGWNTNAGYGTPEHCRAIESHGITDHHRRTFARVRQYTLFDTIR